MRNEEISTSCETTAILNVEFKMLFTLLAFMGKEGKDARSDATGVRE